jgi:ribosomal-protein-alanine N-acetyltransferase
MRIETGRLILYPLTMEDLKRAVKDLASVACRYGARLPRLGFWEMRSRRRIYRAKLALAGRNPGGWLLSTAWLIVEREGKTVVGEAGLKGPPVARYAVEIGYGMLEGFRNKGYMTEAVGALTLFALYQEQYRVERVTALTLPGNIASHRVLEKNRYMRRPSSGKYWLWEREKSAGDKQEGVQYYL